MTMATTQTTTKAFTFTNNPMGNNPLSEAGGIGRKYNDKGFSFGAVCTISYILYITYNYYIYVCVL
jgi:hypothetical protein